MNWLVAGLACCAASVLAGAFGAHGLSARLDPRGVELWETAARYLMYGGLGVALVGFASRVLGLPLTAAGACLLSGSFIFSGTVFALALGSPRWLGAVTPVGGVLMVVGFLLFAVATWR
ncbi:MAG: DUF423 domain-containing protein [Thermoanaerobaculia bacterium]